MSAPPLRALWLIDHVCYDGSLHGGGRLFRNLLPEFDRSRVEVFPYFLRSTEEVRRVFADAPVPVANLAKGKYDPTTLLTVWRLCRRHRIDVMHLFCYASSTFGRLVGVAAGIPTVIHDFDTQVYFPYPLYLKLLDRALAGSTGRGVAASPVTRDYMRDVRRVPADRIDLMPHAVPIERFVRPADDEIGRRRAALGWKPDETVFAVPTKLGPDRGNEYLMASFARALAERPALRLVLVYKPTYYHRVPEQYRDIAWIRDTAAMRAALEERIAALGIGPRVELVESLDRPEEYVLASDAVVAPFLHERFSSVHLLEAMACGKPVVATDLGEQKLLIEPGTNGLLVLPGSESELAAALVRIADDVAGRRRMGAAAADTAARHSIRAAAGRLSELYERLARVARGR